MLSTSHLTLCEIPIWLRLIVFFHVSFRRHIQLLDLPSQRGQSSLIASKPGVTLELPKAHSTKNYAAEWMILRQI